MKVYKVKKKFGNYEEGVLVQLTDSDAEQYKEFVEPFTRNKKGVTGATKTAVALLMLGASLMFSPAKAADISVSVSTYPVNEAATLSPQLVGAAKIEKLVIANSSSTATLVTVYEKCASTTTVVAVLRVIAPANGNAVLDFANYNLPFTYTDVCFRKADAADYVYVSAHYR
jgi:hypothetical protein